MRDLEFTTYPIPYTADKGKLDAFKQLFNMISSEYEKSNGESLMELAQRAPKAFMQTLVIEFQNHGAYYGLQILAVMLSNVDAKLFKEVTFGDYQYSDGYIGMQALKAITVPETLGETISSSAFANCVNLEYADISGLESLPQQLFKDCINLKEVVIGKISMISFDAFCGCKNLEKIIYKGTKEEWRHEVSRIYGWDSDFEKDIIIQCSDGKLMKRRK